MGRSFVVCVSSFALSAQLAAAQSSSWIHQFGTPAIDTPRGIVTDGAGGMLVCGSTLGSLAGPSAGGADAFVLRFDGDGVALGSTQFGSDGYDYATAAAPDESGGCFVAGFTLGNFGGANSGGEDAWITRIDAAGAVVWTRQLGTNTPDFAFAMASDGVGGVYVGGGTSAAIGAGAHAGAQDAWLARLNEHGQTVWMWQTGTAQDDAVRAIASDGSGGCVLAGVTRGSLHGANAGADDTWLARLDAQGTLVWGRQIGAGGFDTIEALTRLGDGGWIAVGQTTSSIAAPNAGSADAWIVRLESDGTERWMQQFGTSGNDVATAVAEGPLGSAHVGGKTRGALGGASAGFWDAWRTSIDAVGERAAIEQFGTSGDDEVVGALRLGEGGVGFAGITFGALAGPHHGLHDAWVGRWAGECLDPLPYCTSGISSSGCSPTLTGSGTASASENSSLTLTATGLDGERTGLMFYGIDNRGFTPSVWAAGSSSWLCVRAPIQRSGTQTSGGTAGQCDGQLTLDWSAFVSANPTALGAPFSSGDEVFVQTWYRDPAAPKGTQLTNGLRVHVCP